MKRNRLILEYVLKHTTRVPELKGVTTQEVALALSIQRSNASKDLNELVRAGKIEKIPGRPVTYIKAFEDQLPEKKHVKSYKESSDQKIRRVSVAYDFNDIFARFVGTKGSMKNAIEQAKAAILYPPKGLNCLINGPTGSGKTYFAHAMFEFAKEQGVVSAKKELTVFNCADYANNPELLMSHLFGHAKGAFTGADQEKTGIIDDANNGMLFLDEIHRLPPVGQEMIFYFMDHGTFSRLGESTKHHQANVRIIGATTEDPSSSLLETFVRRIPINIQLPTFESRPAAEKLELIKILVAQEAKRISREITLTEDVVKALIGSVSYGNIGQLKSNIQLVCARGFLNHMDQDVIAITLPDLPEGIRSGLLLLSNKREVLQELSPLLEPKMVIAPNEELLAIKRDNYELPYNLYDIIGDKAAVLKTEGLDQQTINHFITTDINIHLKSFYKDHGFSFDTTSKLAEFVDEKIIAATHFIYDLAKEKLGYSFQENFIYALSLHISSLLKKLQDGEIRQENPNIRQMVADYPKEFAVAQDIRHYLIETFSFEIPESEADYLAVLLISLKMQQKVGKIGIVVAAHGKSTATSMVQVVTQLLGATQVKAVDMPLDMSPETALKKIKLAVTEVAEDAGVLLLVDMGSLSTFTEKIMLGTKIEVKTIDMVTTSLVLEAVRKASIVGTDLNSLAASLEDFRGYGEVKKNLSPTVSSKKQGILAICASGVGTAKKLKERILKGMSQSQQEKIEVLTLSVVDLKEKLPEITADYDLICATGIVNPQLDIPFIPLETFIEEDVDHLLQDILPQEKFMDPATLTEDKAKTLAINFMEENATYLNPKKMAEPIWQFVMDILKEEHFEKAYGLAINLALHTSGMLERAICKDPLSIPEEKRQSLLAAKDYPILHFHVKTLERYLHIKIPVEEEFYLREILEVHRQKDSVL